MVATNSSCLPSIFFNVCHRLQSFLSVLIHYLSVVARDDFHANSHVLRNLLLHSGCVHLRSGIPPTGAAGGCPWCHRKARAVQAGLACIGRSNTHRLLRQPGSNPTTNILSSANLAFGRRDVQVSVNLVFLVSSPGLLFAYSTRAMHFQKPANHSYLKIHKHLGPLAGILPSRKLAINGLDEKLQNQLPCLLEGGGIAPQISAF